MLNSLLFSTSHIYICIQNAITGRKSVGKVTNVRYEICTGVFIITPKIYVTAMFIFPSHRTITHTYSYKYRNKTHHIVIHWVIHIETIDFSLQAINCLTNLLVIGYCSLNSNSNHWQFLLLFFSVSIYLFILCVCVYWFSCYQ